LLPIKHKQFGLIGKNIEYSFSRKYFFNKFSNDSFADCTYENFDLQSITEFPKLIKTCPNLKGLNVTIPYKQSVIPFLDKLSKKAAQIGAVNVIKFTKNGKLKGCNSDYYGFKKSFKSLMQAHHKKALILGTGGAAKAIAFALDELHIYYEFVSREQTINSISYQSITQSIFDDFKIVINCTPLGTSPNTDAFPDLPYAFFTKQHIAFDLIYNPEETLFLQKAKAYGAVTKNGYEMLVFQAEKAWKIWNK
jgi:shikimate dehydrogenase